MWMNEHEIEQAEKTWAGHPVLGPASATLASLMRVVNGCSDGWPCWRAPSNAAAQLQDMISEASRHRYQGNRQFPADAVLAAKLKLAYAQLRAFRTRQSTMGRDLAFRIHGAPGVKGDPEPPKLPQTQIRLRITGTRAEVTVTGGAPLAPGRYIGVVARLASEVPGQVAS